MKKVKKKPDTLANVKVSNQMKCSVLTSDLMLEIDKRFQRSLKEYEYQYNDYDLLDAIIEMLESSGEKDSQHLIRELRRSVKRGTRVTKRFYHLDRTLSNLDGYLEVGKDRAPANWNVNFKVALSIVDQMMNIDSILQPIHIEGPEDMYKVWTNTKARAGLISPLTKGEIPELAFSIFSNIKKAVEENRDFEEIQIPCVMFHRAQIGGYTVGGDRWKKNGIDWTLEHDTEYFNESNLKLKDRFIWGEDAATQAFEGQYAMVLISCLMRSFYGYVGGDEPMTIRNKMDKLRRSMHSWYGLDFEKFDQTIQPWLIHELFNLVRKRFDSAYWHELNFIEYNFINTKVVVPGGRVVTKHRGIPSGSHFTQIIGSMANAAMVLTYLSSLMEGSFEEKIEKTKHMIGWDRDNTYAMFVMGDDDTLGTLKPLDLTDMSKYLNSVFGCAINVSKTESCETHAYPVFLKREWRSYQGEYRDFLDLFINIIHPERWRTYKNYSPWHILYGIYLTYTATLSRYVSEQYLLEKMKHSAGGFEALLSLDYRELPGSLRQYGNKAPVWIYRRAKAMGLAA